MNREEQIIKAAEDRFETESRRAAFEMGALWADAHPKENEVEMWVARDDDKGLCIFHTKPILDKESGMWFDKSDTDDFMQCSEDFFPEVTFANSPMKVRLTLVKE